MKTGGTLAFRNEVQKALFDIELAGQISDGHWENATPYGHYKPWCDANTVVDPTNLGRDFYASRDYYGFSSPNLLDVIEGRILAFARMTLVLGIEEAKLFSSCIEFNDETGEANVGDYADNGISTFWADRRAKAAVALQEHGLTIGQLNAICINETLFNHKQLVRELRDMSKICRMRRALP